MGFQFYGSFCVTIAFESPVLELHIQNIKHTLPNI